MWRLQEATAGHNALAGRTASSQQLGFKNSIAMQADDPSAPSLNSVPCLAAKLVTKRPRCGTT